MLDRAPRRHPLDPPGQRVAGNPLATGRYPGEMHDPRVLLDPATDAVRKLARRGYALDVSAVDKLLSGRNAAIQRGDEARAEAKRVAQSVKGASAEERPALVERARELKTVVAAADEEQNARWTPSYRTSCSASPTCPSTRPPTARARPTPSSSRTWGEPPEIAAPRDHIDLGERLGILDLARATKLAGPRFAVLRGKGAKLERALARYFLDVAEANGYTEFSVPTLVNRPTMTGTGQLPKFESDLFRTSVGDRELFLIPTAEVPLTNLHAGETLALERLPLAYTAHTPCYRSEAGSYGKDTRGLIRMHEFAKVELVRIVDARALARRAGRAGRARRGGAAGPRAALPRHQARGGRHRLRGAAHVRHRGVAARPAGVPGDRVGVGLRHVPGAAGGHPHQGEGRHARVRGHAQQLGAAHRAHARRRSRARSTGRRLGRDCPRRSCPMPGSTS